MPILKSYFTNGGDKVESPRQPELKLLAFDLGKKAIPELMAGLDHPDEDKANLAAQGLASIGGTNAVAALRAAYQKKPSEFLKTELCFSLATTGLSEDVDFLICALQADHQVDLWPATPAAFSLEVLKAERARDALYHATNKNHGTFAPQAAQEALRWMDEGPWQTPPFESDGEEEAIIHAVLRNSVPRTEDERGFHNSTTNRLWVLSGRSWTREPQEKPRKGSPVISFGVFVAEDASRALCFIGLHFGFLNASGYEYLLNRRDAKWAVIGMAMTWVS